MKKIGSQPRRRPFNLRLSLARGHKDLYGLTWKKSSKISLIFIHGNRFNAGKANVIKIRIFWIEIFVGAPLVGAQTPEDIKPKNLS